MPNFPFDAEIKRRLRTEIYGYIISNPDRGVNESYLVTLLSGMKAIWKPHAFRYKNEIASYLVDRKIGLI